MLVEGICTAANAAAIVAGTSRISVSSSLSSVNREGETPAWATSHRLFSERPTVIAQAQCARHVLP